MKTSVAISFLGAILIGTLLCATAFAGPMEDAATKGAALFADTALGTNGKSCASCHSDGKVWAGKPRFPKVALGGAHTLDQAVQICITNALQGKPLAWDDARLTALVVFVDGRYAAGAK